jgi:hypothetical protein
MHSLCSSVRNDFLELLTNEYAWLLASLNEVLRDCLLRTDSKGEGGEGATGQESDDDRSPATTASRVARLLGSPPIKCLKCFLAR